MKPGDLVKGKPYNTRFSGAVITPMTGIINLGIIIRESNRTNYWGDTIHKWWWILTENGQMIEEVENYIENVQ